MAMAGTSQRFSSAVTRIVTMILAGRCCNTEKELSSNLSLGAQKVLRMTRRITFKGEAM